MNRRTKALQISHKTRERVYSRDGCECVLCRLMLDCHNSHNLQCAHFIGRAQSGLGIEENLVTLCENHHRDYDQSARRTEYREIIEKYLADKYPGWYAKRLVYDKWRDNDET